MNTRSEPVDGATSEKLNVLPYGEKSDLELSSNLSYESWLGDHDLFAEVQYSWRRDMGYSSGAWELDGNRLANRHKYDEAIACYDTALEHNEKRSYFWNKKAYGIAHTGRCNEAIGCYDKALELDDKDAIAWNNKGIVLARTGRYSDAIACYEEALVCHRKPLIFETVLLWCNKGLAFLSFL